jgi:hypothetical protein
MLLIEIVGQSQAAGQASAAPPAVERPAPPVIAVISPPEMDTAMAEALNRFRGEAAAVGFTVVVVTGSGGATPATQMESASRAVAAVASVAFVSTEDPIGLDVWFTDRVNGGTIVDHVSVDSEQQDRALVLAVKAVDVLRARMFDLLAIARKPDAPRAHERPGQSPAPPSAEAAVSEDLRGGGVGVGVGTLQSTQGLERSFLPLLRGELGVANRWMLRLTLGGFGTEPVVSAPGARASVSQSFGMFECAFVPGRRRLRPTFTLGGGAYYVSADGTATAPYTAHTAGRLFAAVEALVGLRAIVSRRLSATLEAGPTFLFPQPQVSLAGMDPQRTGRPTVFAALMIEARL